VHLEVINVIGNEKEVDLYINPYKYTITSDGCIYAKQREYVDSLGRKYTKNKIKLKPARKPNGYMVVSILDVDGNKKNYYLHRLVYTTFSGENNYVGDYDVHHVDYNKDNCSYSNLEKMSHRDNMGDFILKKYGLDINKDNNNYCPTCGIKISKQAIHCKKCLSKMLTSYKIKKVDIINSLNNSKGNFTQSAKEFSMTDNALRKWCKKYGLPSKSGDWK